MTVREAEKALGAKLRLDYAADGNDCAYAFRTVDPDRSYMIDGGRIVRIDIDIPRKGHVRSRVATALGFGIGSSQRDIVRAYGHSLAIEPHPYLEDQGSYLVIDSPGHRRGIIFETDHGKVTEFRAGLYPALSYIEGCS